MTHTVLWRAVLGRGGLGKESRASVWHYKTLYGNRAEITSVLKRACPCHAFSSTALKQSLQHDANVDSAAGEVALSPLTISPADQVHTSSSSSSTKGFFTPEYSSSQDDKQRQSPPSSNRISDHEYEVRVGRAYDLLRATIPDFMRIGLVDYDQAAAHDKRSSSSMTLLDVLTFRTLRDRAAEDGLLGLQSAEKSAPSSTLSLSSSADFLSTLASSHDGVNVQSYHSNIHFRFCANASTSASNRTADLTDEEAASLSFSGRNLYFASAQVLRHTLNILFADANVVIESIRRERKGKGVSASEDLTDDSTQSLGANQDTLNGHSRCGDAIHLRVGFVGHLRVTGAEHRYTVLFRYDFDPESGKIIKHTVERIEPAIGRKLWTGLAAVWLRITGHSSNHQPVATAVPATQFARNVSSTPWSDARHIQQARAQAHAHVQSRK